MSGVLEFFSNSKIIKLDGPYLDPILTLSDQAIEPVSLLSSTIRCRCMIDLVKCKHQPSGWPNRLYEEDKRSLPFYNFQILPLEKETFNVNYPE